MKIKFILSAVAALAMFSCSSDDAVNISSQDDGRTPITFDNPYLGANTRASELTFDGLKTQGFITLAKHASADTVYMDSVLVKYESLAASGGVLGWKTASTFFWPQDGTGVNFYFYSAPTGVVKSLDRVNKKIKVIQKGAIGDMADVLWAPKLSNMTKGTGALTPAFQHAMSRIRFTAKVDSTSLTRAKVQSIKIKGKFAMSADMDLAASTSSSLWSNQAYAATDTTFAPGMGTVNDIVVMGTTGMTGVGQDIFVIPGTVATSIEVTFYDIDHNKTFTKTASIASQVYEPGNMYVFGLVLSVDIVTFSVTAIPSWTGSTPSVSI